jgi:ribosomal protein S18 acetylase RimI-like enzyme
LIRAYYPSDLPALYRICLLTGDSGRDASGLFRDPELLGHYYTGPYAVLEPELCFVLACEGAPCGYILGAADTLQFNQRCEREWFPPLRTRYPLPPQDDRSPDAHIIRLIHTGRLGEPPGPEYPAHLHIDLLPAAQGQGWGRRLMEAFCERLRMVGAGGVHLGVAKDNPGAVGFYRRLGFVELGEGKNSITFGMRL